MVVGLWPWHLHDAWLLICHRLELHDIGCVGGHVVQGIGAHIGCVVLGGAHLAVGCVVLGGAVGCVVLGGAVGCVVQVSMRGRVRYQRGNIILLL